MFRFPPISARSLQKLFLLTPRNVQQILAASPVHTTAAVLKWGDVFIPPDLKKFDPESFPKDYKEHPDRDLVNYPHPIKYNYPPKVRLGIFPDSWFTIFYPKTGVTGSYLFYGGLYLYLLNKEWFIYDEEVHLFYIFAIIFFCAYKLYGANLAQYQWNFRNEELKELENHLGNKVSALTNAIQLQKQYITAYGALPSMIAAVKRDNLQMQLEAAYRRRLLKAHGEVKRRLDYMADLEEAKRRFQRRYMIDWIVDQVKKTVTAQQEKVLLSQCVADLKALSQRTKV